MFAVLKLGVLEILAKLAIVDQAYVDQVALGMLRPTEESIADAPQGILYAIPGVDSDDPERPFVNGPIEDVLEGKNWTAPGWGFHYDRSPDT